MRSNEDFKAEILRRRQVILQKRRRNTYLFSSCAVALILCTVAVFAMSPWEKNPLAPNGINREESVPSVIIVLKDRTLTEEEDVAPRLKVLEKYVSLSDSADDDTFSEYLNIWGTVSTDCTADRSTGMPFSPEGEPVAVFTVIIDGVSTDYSLRESSLVVNKTAYWLTADAFEELYDLFGGE